MVVREISAMQLKKCYKKGCQLFAAHVEEASRDEVAKIGDHDVLTEFKDMYFRRYLDYLRRETSSFL
jgi:hypothetical protein